MSANEFMITSFNEALQHCCDWQTTEVTKNKKGIRIDFTRKKTSLTPQRFLSGKLKRVFFYTFSVLKFYNKYLRSLVLCPLLEGYINFYIFFL